MPSLHPPTDSVSLALDDLRHTRVWDLPTRLFHWLLAASVIALIITGNAGAMEWHFRLGYGVLALLVFRIVWGFVGGRWSRFRSFLYAPHALWRYLRGRAHPDHLVGHTPLGALSVFALLATLAAQVISGLFADDEIATSGPLTRFVSSDTVSWATHWHTTLGKWLLIGLAGLHVLAVLYYVGVKGHQLVEPMISGDKDTLHPTPESRDDAVSRTLALVLVVLCGALAYWIASLRA